MQWSSPQSVGWTACRPINDLIGLSQFPTLQHQASRGKGGRGVADQEQSECMTNIDQHKNNNCNINSRAIHGNTQPSYCNTITNNMHSSLTTEEKVEHRNGRVTGEKRSPTLNGKEAVEDEQAPL